MHRARDIAFALRADCEALFSQLIHDAHQEGGEWRGHLASGGSVSMAMRGTKRGVWSNWDDASGRQRGDPLDLIAWVLFAGDRGPALRWAIGWLGLDQRGVDPPRDVPADRPTPPRGSIADDDRRRRALGLYLAGEEMAPPIEAYLAGRLGIGLDELPEPPRSLRFLARCWHAGERTHAAAIVAPVVNLASGAQCGAHLTYIAPNGPRWSKAFGAESKRMAGPCKRGVIPLSRGPSGRRLRDMPAGETVLIGEGIENSLAGAFLCPTHVRVWAAMTVGNLVMLELPEAVRTVISVRDNDAPDSPAAALWREAIARWSDKGREVRWLIPPPRFKDMTEYLLETSEFTANEPENADG